MPPPWVGKGVPRIYRPRRIPPTFWAHKLAQGQLKHSVSALSQQEQVFPVQGNSDNSMLVHLAALAHYHCGTAAAIFAKVVYGGRHAAKAIEEKKPLLVFEEDTKHNDSNATLEL